MAFRWASASLSDWASQSPSATPKPKLSERPSAQPKEYPAEAETQPRLAANPEDQQSGTTTKKSRHRRSHHFSDAYVCASAPM